MDDMQIMRQKRVEALADGDKSYQMWKACREEFRQAFAQYANSQPEQIRNFLWGYAQSAEMAQQRLLNIACEKMIFPGEK